MRDHWSHARFEWARRVGIVFILSVSGCGDTVTSEDSGDVDAARTDANVGDAASASDAGEPLRDADHDASAVLDAGAVLDASTGTCSDGLINGEESDVDCGGRCEACANGRRCNESSDCKSEDCNASLCSAPDGAHPDIVRIIDVAGRDPGNGWGDSYSVGDQCYCDSTFDHDIGAIPVETPVGRRTVREVCDAIGPGPGSEPAGEARRPVYNDIQCGNGPANNAGDEDDCPGRVDIGRSGCGHIGPRWDLSGID